MTTITLDVPEKLSEQLAQAKDRLPELLALGLVQPALPAHMYAYVLNFLADRPTPEQIAAFKPTPEMTERLRLLLAREKADGLTKTEKVELDEFERIEHLVVMLKAGAFSFLGRQSKA